MARRSNQTNNHLKTEVRISKPPLKLYVGLGVFGALVIIAAMIIFRFEFGVILLVVGGFGGLWFVGKVVKSVGGGVVWCLHTYHDYTHKVRMDDAEYRKAYLMSVSRTEFLYDSRSASVVVEAMPQAIPGQAKLLPDGSEQSQQRQMLRQVIEDRRHIAILGHTGSGKTSTMAHALSIQKSLNPDAITILMDNHIKHSEWPPVDEVLWRHEDMATRFDWLWADFLERKNPYGDHDEQPVIVVFDEFTGSKKHLEGIDKKYDEIITNLLQEAWKFGIYFIVGTHSMLVKEIGLSIDTRLNFTWLRLDKENTRYNFGTLLDANFKPISEVELCGPYSGSEGGRFFSRTQQVRRLPPPEVEVKICPVCSSPLTGKQKYCSDKCRQKAYRERRQD